MPPVFICAALFRGLIHRAFAAVLFTALSLCYHYPLSPQSHSPLSIASRCFDSSASEDAIFSDFTRIPSGAVT